MVELTLLGIIKLIGFMFKYYWGRNIFFGGFTIFEGFLLVRNSIECGGFIDTFLYDGAKEVSTMMLILISINIIGLLINNICEHTNFSDDRSEAEKLIDRKIDEMVILQGMIDGTD